MQPVIQIYQTPMEVDSIPITKLPEGKIDSKIDNDFVDIIRNQLLPTGIENDTTSDLKDEITDMVSLLGAFVEEDSIEKAKAVIYDIHERLDEKSESLVRSWVKELTNLHPKIDKYIRENLPYFMNRYSEIMGTNTVMFYADTSSIDIKYWTKNPSFKSDKIEWNTDVWSAPSYLRESVREKTPDLAVDYIQGACHVTSKLMARNITSAAHETRDVLLGNTKSQSRPIDPGIAHGASLNNDWYHQALRVVGSGSAKDWSRTDIIDKVDEGGYLVHVLINHITPLTYEKVANTKDVEIKIEETFPGAKGESITVSSNGQRVTNSKKVNDEVIVPEEIKNI